MYISTIHHINTFANPCPITFAIKVTDLHDNGYPVREGDVEHGFPASINKMAELVHLLTTMVFIQSCQHAAVNFSQMDVYGFPPNSPSFMKQPPPTKKGVTDLAAIMKALPSKRQATMVITFVFTLTRLSPDEVYKKIFTFVSL